MNPTNYAITDSPLVALAAAATLPGGAVLCKHLFGQRTFYHAECFRVPADAEEYEFAIYTTVADVANHLVTINKPMLRCSVCKKWCV